MITFSPAKNGTRLFFVGDHTFFGDVVNIAETLQVICWYKVMDASLYTSSLIMFPLKRQQQKWTIFCSTAITVSNNIMCLKLFYRMNLAPLAFSLLDWVSYRQITFLESNCIISGAGRPFLYYGRGMR